MLSEQSMSKRRVAIVSTTAVDPWETLDNVLRQMVSEFETVATAARPFRDEKRRGKEPVRKKKTMTVVTQLQLLQELQKHITKQVAAQMKLVLKTAERLKKEHEKAAAARKKQFRAIDMGKKGPNGGKLWRCSGAKPPDYICKSGRGHSGRQLGQKPAAKGRIDRHIRNVHLHDDVRDAYRSLGAGFVASD